ncbi:MAG: hypothetical protein SAJ37_03325 [Oscillatoria sp. PMC 1068.18]|nr:hypothetical protein [Oscillatoria sp. PMC 1068.18]
MFESAVTFYFMVAIAVSSICLVAFFQDTTTPKTDLISWIAIFVATLFWLLIVPISCWELFNKKSFDTIAPPEQDYFLATSKPKKHSPTIVLY